ncbi:hypothetical protein ABH920_006351 [Catenulispora sp. EB89]|uniref:endonuclease NucS domain-containing protein n=1 Tax=Catenulispora sp. EB89 TaxID=3156257 RepID=UPI00351129FD
MPVPSELELRDRLVRNLDVIEPGLKPVRYGEYPLPNSNGTRGSIDILARDRHGMWVVIELKRSKAASRQALHEVMKYAELLCSEKHLPADRIRTIVVSTEWSELLVPTSSAARDWSYDLRGYHLRLDEEGAIVGAERVEFLEASFEHWVSPIHMLFFFDSADQRDQMWDHIVWWASQFDAPDLVAADFDRVARKEIIPRPFGLYLAVGVVDPAQASDDLLVGYDGPEPFAEEYPAEYLLLCKICNGTAGADHDLEGAVPGLLRNIAADSSWKIQGYRVSGAFQAMEDLSDTDLFLALSGDAHGDSQIIFTGSANPQMATRWKGFLRQTENSLAGNETWEILVRGWLNDAAARVGDGDVWLHVYNPCDLLEALVFAWPDKVGKYLPNLAAGTHPKAGDGTFARGTLCWTRQTPWNFADAVRLVYQDPQYWSATRYGGITWQHDLDLLDLLGLEYVLLDQIGVTPHEASVDNEHRIWTVQNSSAVVHSSRTHPSEYSETFRRLAQDRHIISIMQYLKHNSEYVDIVVQEYREFVSILDPERL